MNNNLLTLENISLISTMLVNLVLIVVVVLIKNKTRNNYYFIGFISSIFAWTISTFVFLLSDGIVPLISAAAFYISGSIIPVFIILFTKTFPRESLGFSRSRLMLFLSLPIIICACVLLPGGVVQKIILDGTDRSIVFGALYPLLFVYIVAYFSTAFVVMYRKYTILVGVQKKQVQIIFTSIVFATVSALIVSLLMPTLGNFSLFWAGPFFSGYMLLTITYAIIRYGFFDIKLVATEFLTFATWILLFIKIFFDNTDKDRIIDSLVLAIIIVCGILIIKSVKKETALNERLEQTNIQLKELDQKKTEFMSLATHQLRTPLTAMKGYSSMILDGTFGKEQNPEIEEAISTISRSTTDLTMIVEDYLNISMIEQGRMQYNFAKCDVAKIVGSIVDDMKNTADRLGLKIYLDYDKDATYDVNVDEGKIRQVFLNVIDNAMKYTPKGQINIYITKTTQDKIQVKVEDTGVGINPEVLPTLFHKFVRAPDASKVNILGTGLGLYVAGEILKAHDGRAWGESKGEGKGSTFYIELAIA